MNYNTMFFNGLKGVSFNRAPLMHEFKFIYLYSIICIFSIIK